MLIEDIVFEKQLKIIKLKRSSSAYLDELINNLQIKNNYYDKVLYYYNSTIIFEYDVMYSILYINMNVYSKLHTYYKLSTKNIYKLLHDKILEYVDILKIQYYTIRFFDNYKRIEYIL